MPLAEHLSQFFVTISSHASFPAVMGVYSSVLGFFVPSGGGKWIIEAPYVIEAAKTLNVHLGWAVTVYNAAEALPNLSAGDFYAVGACKHTDIPSASHAVRPTVLRVRQVVGFIRCPDQESMLRTPAA